MGGKAFYLKGQDGDSILANVENYQTKSLNVSWVCQENYDEDLKTFNFVPDFKNYKLAAGLEMPVLTVNVMGDIIIPPLHPIPEEEHRPFTIREDISGMGTAPSYLNNYTSGKLSPIRNQDPYGSCWAFSNIAAVEADLIHDGKADTSIDLSELHLAYFSYHKFTDEKGLKCTIKGLNSSTAYEFYVMKYKTARSKKYYSMGLLVPYKVSASGLTAPQSNPVVAMNNSGYTTFTIKKSSNATGISVLYREGEGVFRLACEASGNSCSTTLNTSKNYTFYIMQYRIRNGKKVYSDGIIARDFSSGKNGEFERLYTGFTLADENFDMEGIYNALDDFYTEEDLLLEEAFTAIGEDMISKDALEYGDYEFDDVDYSWVDESGDYLYDEYEWTDNQTEGDSMADGFETVSIDEAESAEGYLPDDEGEVLYDPEYPKADTEDVIYLYTFDDTAPSSPAPSFGNK